MLTAGASTSRGATVYGSAIAGTLDYAAPEQLGKLPGVKVGPAADVYGFAKTLCFALFNATEPTNRHYNQLPPPVADLIGRCLSRDPKERPRGFGEVDAELAAAEAAPGPAPTWEVVAPPATPVAPPPDATEFTYSAPEESHTRPRSRRDRDEWDDVPRRGSSGSERVSHAMLAIFLGAFGVHKFAQGHSANGVVRAVIGLLLCLQVMLVVGIIEGIQYLSMSDAEYARTYLRRKKDWF